MEFPQQDEGEEDGDEQDYRHGDPHQDGLHHTTVQYSCRRRGSRTVLSGSVLMGWDQAVSLNLSPLV